MKKEPRLFLVCHKTTFLYYRYTFKNLKEQYYPSHSPEKDYLACQIFASNFTKYKMILLRMSSPNMKREVTRNKNILDEIEVCRGSTNR